MTTVLHPRGNKITVLMDPPKTKSEGGIEVGNAKLEDHETGTVLEVGPGIVLRNAAQVSSHVLDILKGDEFKHAMRPINPNDRVIFGAYAGMRATIGGKNIAILEDSVHNSEIIGVLEGEGE